MITMTCGQCQHQADLDEFMKTPIGGQLPKGVFQCPACQKAFERKTMVPGIRYPSGLFIPGPVQIVATITRL